MDNEEMNIIDIDDNTDSPESAPLACAYMDAVSSLNQNIDFSGLGHALIRMAEPIPKIDTTGIATALQTVSAAGTALTKSVCFEESVSTLSSFASALAMAEPISDSFSNGIGNILKAEFEFAQIMEAIVPQVINAAETVCSFTERFGEIYASIREHMEELCKHFSRLLYIVTLHLVKRVQSAVVWVFKQPPPRIVLIYNLKERLKPPLFALAVRRFMEVAPLIRKIYLNQARERGSSSDDADFRLIVAF